ncbi:MAG: FAD-dependent 5-carboxymethylaminomethyl-2-thiouridine(34) oxidoreductase MnmC, partial [Gammaproteobacteria bacterium]
GSSASDSASCVGFYLTAFLYTTHWLSRLQQQHADLGWHAEGVVQLLTPAAQVALARLALPTSILAPLDAPALVEVIGSVAGPSTGVLYAQAGWLQPRPLCRALLQQYPQIQLRTSTSIEAMDYSDGQWQLRQGTAVVATAPVVVLTNGHELRRLLPEYAESVQAVRGQLSYCQAPGQGLTRPVCYDGYVIPLGDGRYCLGASYDRDSDDTALRAADQQRNLAALHAALPQFTCLPSAAGRVAFRATTRDHLPLIGAVPDPEFYKRHYGDLRHGRPAHGYPPAAYRPGLYLNSGHGSRGLTSCPLAAEMLASMIHATPLPVAEELRLATHPARFRVRALKRRRSGE